MTENEMAELAKFAPWELRNLIKGGSLDNADLSFAAEIYGNAMSVDGPHSKNPEFEFELEWGPMVLIPLLKHRSAIVREGAIYGLSGYVKRALVQKVLAPLTEDQSEGVRSAAADILSEINSSPFTS